MWQIPQLARLQRTSQVQSNLKMSCSYTPVVIPSWWLPDDVSRKRSGLCLWIRDRSVSSIKAIHPRPRFELTARNFRLLPEDFHKNRRPICEHLGDSLHHLSSVNADPHHVLPANIRRMLQHQIERLGPRLLAQICQQSNVAADERLQPRPNRSED